MTDLNANLHSHLTQILPSDTLANWLNKLNLESESEKQKMNTPATNCTGTSWRKDGNAIDRVRRKRQIAEKDNNQQRESGQVGDQGTMDQMKNCSTVTTAKILIKNKAVFFGEQCELPYLHSSDAITHLYARKGQQENTQIPVLFNPPASIQRSMFTTLRSLHIYHTNIDSLRQLGTGWCNLKQLSILYGRLVDLSGLSSFSSLEELFIAFNQITSLSDLMFHPTIKCIDLERNKINSMQDVEYLATMDKLEYINLNSNPIMKVKENRRMVQQKLGKILDLEEHTRMLEYELAQMALLHELEGYQGIQLTNAVIGRCNQQLRCDQISAEHIYDSYGELKDEDKQQVDIVMYELTNQGFQDGSEDGEEEQEPIFTPLFHFLSGKKHYTNTLKKYLEGKLYISIRKQESNSNSPAHTFNSRPSSRLAKFTASTRLERKAEEVESADKMQLLTSQVLSLDKTKRNRLSLGRSKKIMERFEKNVNPAPKIMTALSSTATMSRPTLKRTTLFSRKNAPSDLQFELDKRFSKTGNLAIERFQFL